MTSAPGRLGRPSCASDSLVGSAEAIAAGVVFAVSLVATATVLGFVGGYLLS